MKNKNLSPRIFRRVSWHKNTVIRTVRKEKYWNCNKDFYVIDNEFWQVHLVSIWDFFRTETCLAEWYLLNWNLIQRKYFVKIHRRYVRMNKKEGTIDKISHLRRENYKILAVMRLSKPFPSYSENLGGRKISVKRKLGVVVIRYPCFNHTLRRSTNRWVPTTYRTKNMIHY